MKNIMKFYYVLFLVILFTPLFVFLLIKANVISGMSFASNCNSIFDCISYQNGHYSVKNWERIESFKKSEEFNYYPPNSTWEMHGWVDPILPCNASINGDGFRGPNFPIQKENNTLRIILLGDSLTFGYGLNDNETINHFLKKALQKRITNKNVEILNLGVSGFNSKKEILRYFHKGVKYHPDIVVMFYFHNDIEAFNIWANLDYMLRGKYHLNASQTGTIVDQDLIPSYYHYLYSRYGISNLIQTRVIKYYEQLLDYNNNNSISTLFIVFPDKTNVEKMLKFFFSEKQSHFYILNSNDYQYRKPWAFSNDDPHPSPFGAKKVSDVVSNEIVKLS